MRAPTSEALLCCLALLAVLPGCDLGVPPVFQFADPKVSAPGDVVEGGTLAVTATLTNLSDTTLTPDKCVLQYTGDAAWGDASLHLTANADFMTTATFTGQLTAPAQPGTDHLTWTAMLGTDTFGAPFELEVAVTAAAP
jgi:hypothetical protein